MSEVLRCENATKTGKIAIRIKFQITFPISFILPFPHKANLLSNSPHLYCATQLLSIQPRYNNLAWEKIMVVNMVTSSDFSLFQYCLTMLIYIETGFELYLFKVNTCILGSSRGFFELFCTALPAVLNKR